MKLGDIMGNKPLIVAPTEQRRPMALAAESAGKELQRIQELKQHKFYSYFPDEGPFRRELYPEHMKFVRAGATHRFRCFMGANRIGKCVSFQSLIDTPFGSQSVGELYERGEAFPVYAWSGGRRVVATASAPFKKSGLHHCYRITMADGRWVECADEHRILTHGGFRAISELLPQFALGRIPSNSGFAPLVRALDVPHLFGRLRDYLGHCFADFHLYDEQLQFVPGTVQAFAPSLDGVRQHTYDASLLLDATANRRTSSLLSGDDRLSSPCDPLLHGGRFVGSSNQNDAPSVRLLNDKALAAPQFVAAEDALLQEDTEPLFSNDCRYTEDSLSASQTPFLHDVNRIVRVDYVGRKEVFDFEVKNLHNYTAAGLVHHNTQVAAFELAHHLVGIYPVWWEGKRFDHPIEAWCGNVSWEKVRDVCQLELCGTPAKPEEMGSGFLPREYILRHNYHGFSKFGIDILAVRHVPSGGVSLCQFKAYTQGAQSFESNAKHFIWFDEEVPPDVNTAAELRTMTVEGQVITTYTPVLGLTEVTEMILRESDRL